MLECMFRDFHLIHTLQSGSMELISFYVSPSNFSTILHHHFLVIDTISYLAISYFNDCASLCIFHIDNVLYIDMKNMLPVSILSAQIWEFKVRHSTSHFISLMYCLGVCTPMNSTCEGHYEFVNCEAPLEFDCPAIDQAGKTQIWFL